MAVLIDADRAAVSGDFQRDKSAVREAFGALVKADIRAAINAIDDWLDVNAAALNTAIPQPARAALTTQQKLDLILRVLQRRVKGN
jgi:hypothetical protein